MRLDFFTELKRRHVYRVAVAYVAVGWLLIEGATQVVPYFHVPGWTVRLLVLLVSAGFPIALILAWAFEVTPDGVRRTKAADSPQAREPEQHRKVGRVLDRVIIGVLALALILAVWRPWSSHVVSGTPAALPLSSRSAVSTPAAAKTVRAASPAPATTDIPAKSIAVLPFENLSTDKSNGYFADGIQDLILTKLADIGDLKVISRTSTMQYGSHPQNLKKVGLELGVATLLEGSVQKAGDQVLINVQLINAGTDSHIWANSYQRTLKNVFGVEGEVAGKIAQSLAATLSPAESRRLARTLSTNPAANDLYFRAQYFSARGQLNLDVPDFAKAIPLYRQAIAKAPDFAQARAQLSITESMLAWFGGGGKQVKQLNAEARVQARKALSLMPELTVAQLALGFVDYYGRGDYSAALKRFDAALKLRPNDAGTLAARGYVLRRLGRFDAAIGSLRQALRLDPRNSSRAFDLGLTYTALGRYAKAEKLLQRALALDPNNAQAQNYLAVAMYFSGGNASRALAYLRGKGPRVGRVQSLILMFQHRYAEAHRVLDAIPDTAEYFSAATGPKALLQANLYYMQGQRDKARALYSAALPQARAQLAALAGGASINRAFALVHVARAEVGLGRTAAGLADADRSLAIVQSSGDHFYRAILMEFIASCYAQAGRADLAVPLLTRALATPGIGVLYVPRLLWLDPVWNPIRKTPAFRALLKKYAKYRPTSMAAAATARSGSGA